MTSTAPEPPPVPTSAAADGDARFAAFLADLAAGVDDPQWGEDYRALLNDDPQTQRALFDLVDAVTVAPAPPPSSLLWTAAALLLAAALVVAVVGFVS
jgi:hypothetical protein